ncbi:MAG TPA: MGMT family protein [Patescibacteria group bacterium]
MKKQNKGIASSSESRLNRDESRSLGNSSRLRSNNMSNSYDRIYEVVSKIPKGKVMTYGQVAILANVATPRVVGFAMHVNKDPKNVPCHRVVFADGSLTKGYAFGGEGVQRKKLEDEGIKFTEKGKVDLSKHKAS